MKSIAFVFVGLAIGLLVALIVMKSGYKVSVNKVSPSSSPAENPSTTGAPKASPISETTITAGGKLIFSKYMFTLPSNWQSKDTSQDPKYEFISITTNGGYQIKIEQTAAEGIVCLYPGDPDSGTPFQNTFKYFRQLTTKDGSLLRVSSDNQNSLTFTVCEKKDANYQNPSNYGYIEVDTPSNPSLIMINEIDQILASLKKI